MAQRIPKIFNYWAATRRPSQFSWTKLGPYPSPEADPLAAPTYYVDSAATGTGTGLSWANAFTTIAAAHTTASTGDVIEVSGGASGKSYSLAGFTFTKGVTVQGSKTAGHSGLMTLTGRLYFNNAADGVITLINGQFKDLAVAEFIYPEQYYANSVVSFIDFIIGPYKAISYNAIKGAGSVSTYLRCKFLSRIRTGNSSSLLYSATGATIENYNYCTFDHAGYVSTALPAASTLNIDHCLLLSSGSSSLVTPMFDIGNSALTDVSIKNSIFFGIHPVKSGASSKAPVVENVFWHKSPYLTGQPGSYSTFDTSNKATIVGGITNELPYFTTPKNTPIGDFMVRYDDRNNLDISVQSAAILNPEIKLTHFVDLHGWKSQTRPSSLEIDTMRTLIAGGNEIGSQASTHSNGADLNIITISATGTSPTLTIATTNTGDSSTWTGTLTVTINGTPAVFDLADASYDAIGVLITALNGLAVGDGVVTATKTDSFDSDFLPSCEIGRASCRGSV